MSKTVEEGFREFHGRLTPTGGESEAAKRHRSSIEACLKSEFGLTRFFRTGSFGNGTSIRGHSDVDYFAQIPSNNLHQNSYTTLRRLWNKLDARFPNTGVKVRSPAILVPFGNIKSEWTEVVPADLIDETEDGFKIYEIPNSKGRWVKSSPEMHNVFVSIIDKEKGRKVKPLVRFLKAWKYFRDVPISSFYLELRVAKYSLDQDYIIYSFDCMNVLKLLWNNQLAAIQDPMGISGYIHPCLSDAKKSDAISKLKTSYIRAQKAYKEESEGRIKDAFYWWNLVFNGYFPTYR